jgi:hypothetical protein
MTGEAGSQDRKSQWEGMIGGVVALLLMAAITAGLVAVAAGWVRWPQRGASEPAVSCSERLVVVEGRTSGRWCTLLWCVQGKDRAAVQLLRCNEVPGLERRP